MLALALAPAVPLAVYGVLDACRHVAESRRVAPTTTHRHTPVPAR